MVQHDYVIIEFRTSIPSRATLDSVPSKYDEELFLSQRDLISEWGTHAVEKNYAYRAKVEDVTTHAAWHSFAKNLFDAGTSLDQVAILLGHESLDSTRIYTQPSGRDLEWAVQRAAGEIIRDDG